MLTEARFVMAQDRKQREHLFIKDSVNKVKGTRTVVSLQWLNKSQKNMCVRWNSQVPQLEEKESMETILLHRYGTQQQPLPRVSWTEGSRFAMLIGLGCLNF